MSEEYNSEPALQEEIKQMLQEEAESLETTTQKSSTTEEHVTSEESGTDEDPDLVGKDPEIVRKARALNWKTRKERELEGKDNSHYVEPDEYVRRQPLFDKIDKQKRKIDELEGLTRQSMTNLAKVRQEAYEQALKQLEARKTQAVETADINEYKRADLQHKNLQQQMATDPIVNVPRTENVQQQDILDFQSRNASWFNENTIENKKMKMAADFADKYLYRQAQIDQGLADNQVPHLDRSSHLKAIEKEVQKMFPHRFEKAKSTETTTEKPTTTTVGRSSALKTDTKSVGNLVAQLSPQQRMLGEEFVRMSVDPKTGKSLYSLEEYAKELQKSDRLGK